MSDSKIADTYDSLVRLFDESAMAEIQGVVVTTEFNQTNPAALDAFLRDGVDVCFSVRLNGRVGSDRMKVTRVVERTLDLQSDPKSFTWTLKGDVLQSPNMAPLSNFLMHVEIFDTHNDPMWATPLITLNIHSETLDVRDFM